MKVHHAASRDGQATAAAADLSPVGVRPAYVSQLNCEQVLGLNPRRFLELLPRTGLAIAQVGKLRLVRLSDIERVLGPSVEPSAEATNDDRPASVDEVLAVVGRRVGVGR